MRTLPLGLPILDPSSSIPADQDGMTVLLDMSPHGHICRSGVQTSFFPLGLASGRIGIT